MDPATLFPTLLAIVPVRYLIDVAAVCGVCAAVMPWLPVPARAASAYGRVYALLNIAAQNFRNVTNLARPGKGGSGSSGTPMAGMALLAGLGLSLSACTTVGGTTAIDTAELNADAGAIAFAAEAIEAIPGLSSHLSPDQVARVNAALGRIKDISAQIDAASGGAIDIDTGKGWASALASEFQTILTIATPIVSAFAPGVGAYIQTAGQIIPLLLQAVGLTPASVSVTPDTPSAVRAALYRGV
ncbi:hypothetical protein HLH34_09470 [Gluconacetobacter azotocaptans]|uniref:Uncharacterized protein n=1 Tax=Gluconacetobacter azotocaptans TaxID=142834 RepID=A0A7W4JSP1_9PROT|nr:hypothetical protein [Gluconacetobacter azotocaptans]MBB2190196.1 hypothetical protein [Gluconacetobacter azotocaptans]GBQ29817.1 hypothetical protein AA13594_1488 [Gluconacetobacter azotocaptans DSM 13594]